MRPPRPSSSSKPAEPQIEATYCRLFYPGVFFIEATRCAESAMVLRPALESELTSVSRVSSRTRVCRVESHTALAMTTRVSAVISQSQAFGPSSRLRDRVAFCYLFAMSQPVKLSDSLILDARLTAEIAQRSIAGQIEFWAGLGRAVEGLLRGREVLALRKADAARPLSACFETVDSPEGRQRVAEYLRTRPFPHYEAAAGHPGFLVRIDSDGSRTVGRFVNRRFEPISKSGD